MQPSSLDIELSIFIFSSLKAVALYQGTALAGPPEPDYDSGFSPWAALKVQGLKPIGAENLCGPAKSRG
jgi:hypothetical protein